MRFEKEMSDDAKKAYLESPFFKKCIDQGLHGGLTYSQTTELGMVVFAELKNAMDTRELERIMGK